MKNLFLSLFFVLAFGCVSYGQGWQPNRSIPMEQPAYYPPAQQPIYQGGSSAIVPPPNSSLWDRGWSYENRFRPLDTYDVQQQQQYRQPYPYQYQQQPYQYQYHYQQCPGWKWSGYCWYWGY